MSTTPRASAKLVTTLTAKGDPVSVCYEAGPWGSGIYRQRKEDGRSVLRKAEVDVYGNEESK